MSEHQRHLIYTQLSAHSAHLANGEWLAHMLASGYVGMSYIPIFNCLSPAAYQKLLNRHFSTVTLPDLTATTQFVLTIPEQQDLFDLLMSYRKSADEEIEWIATIVVAGCGGNDHLWQDLGLWSRGELTQLLAYNFPELAAKNEQNMKWKKFLYKQLCLQENVYICRAPSCAACRDYNDCFGTED